MKMSKMSKMPKERVNCNGLTFEEFSCAVGPAWDVNYGHIRTRTKVRTRYRNDGINYGIRSALPPGKFYYIYGSKTRSPHSVIKRAWERGEDPSELRAEAEKKLAVKSKRGMA